MRNFSTKVGKGDLFRYDNIYRLTGVKYGVQNPENFVGNFDNAPYADREIFNMDNVGNRTSVTNGTTTNYTTNNLNQYTAINATNPTYDLNGNMTNDGYNSSIVYDYTNHPVRFDNVDYTVDMRYDALGRRIEKKSTAKADNSVTTEQYILDGARVISDADSAGAAYKDYIWGNGIDELLATAKGRSTKYDFYLNNSLGSITHIANNKAEVQESYKYKVYGNVTVFDKKGEIANKSKGKNRYMFTGREYELETKLYYYRARYYASITGTFLTRDPSFYVDSINLYSYVLSNPANKTDALGLYWKLEFAQVSKLQDYAYAWRWIPPPDEPNVPIPFNPNKILEKIQQVIINKSAELLNMVEPVIAQDIRDLNGINKISIDWGMNISEGPGIYVVAEKSIKLHPTVFNSNLYFSPFVFNKYYQPKHAIEEADICSNPDFIVTALSTILHESIHYDVDKNANRLEWHFIQTRIFEIMTYTKQAEILRELSMRVLTQNYCQNREMSQNLSNKLIDAANGAIYTLNQEYLGISRMADYNYFVRMK